MRHVNLAFRIDDTNIVPNFYKIKFNLLLNLSIHDILFRKIENFEILIRK
jgi:hypothetical protein